MLLERGDLDKKPASHVVPGGIAKVLELRRAVVEYEAVKTRERDGEAAGWPPCRVTFAPAIWVSRPR
jgi:hypothetical protein